jgi:lipoprotein
MKKISHLLILLIFSILLVACGSSGHNREDTKPEITSENSSDEKNTAVASSKSVEETSSQTESPYPIKNYVAIDKDNYSVTVDSMGWDNVSNLAYLNIILENKTTDKTYIFNTEDSFINGLQVHIPMFESAQAGSKSQVVWYLNPLNESVAVKDITDIEALLHVYEYDGKESNEIDTETLHIYPYGQDSTTTYVYEQKDTDKLLIDNEYCTIILVGSDMDNVNYTLKLYIVNKTDETMNISTGENYIDGKKIKNPPYFPQIKPKKSTFYTISWFVSAITDQGIDPSNISNISFFVDAYANGHLNDEHFFKETISFTP